MRRYTFYLAVALLAFGIGSFFAIEFYLNQLEKTATRQNIPISDHNLGEKVFVAEIPKIEFTCEDEIVGTVWKSLDKDKDYADLKHYVINSNQFKNCQELFEKQTVDLNSDKSEEVILRGILGSFCGSSRDCPTWIVSKINNKYKIIFEASVGESPDGLQVLPNKTQQFKDIKVKLYNGWEADNFGFFKFDGKQYQIKRCLKDVNSDYDYDENNAKKLIAVKLKECL